MKFSFDDKLTKGIEKAKQSQEKAIKMALGRVGLAILEDTVQQEPKPPFETGFLRGAQFMHVMGQSKPVPDAIQSGAPAKVDIQAGTFEVSVGLNTPYAMAQHENLKDAGSWEPGTVSKRGTPKDPSGIGGKFLESKLARYKDEYANVFANTFAKFWGTK